MTLQCNIVNEQQDSHQRPTVSDLLMTGIAASTTRMQDGKVYVFHQGPFVELQK